MKSPANGRSPARAVWGASALASDGVVVRGLSMSGRFIHEPLIEFWRAARHGGDRQTMRCRRERFIEVS